jgi:hypothetical protein
VKPGARGARGAVGARGALGARGLSTEAICGVVAKVDAVMVCDDEQKGREDDVKYHGYDISFQQRISHDHAGCVDPSENPQRRRKPRVWTNDVSLPSRELDAHGRKHAKNQNLRRKQQRIRQQARLPLVHRRQKRREAIDDEQLAQYATRKEREQNPQQRGSRHGHIISGCVRCARCARGVGCETCWVQLGRAI